MQAPTARLHQFASNIIWVGIAQLFNSVSLGIIILPALTKSYSPEIYGIWSQVRVTVTLLSPLLGLQLGLAVIRFLAGEEDKRKRRQALGAMLSAILILSFIALIAANILATNLSIFLFSSPDYDIFVRITFLWVFFTALYNFLLSYFYARNKIVFLSIRQIVVSIIVSALVIVLSTQGYSIELVMVSVIAVQAIFALVIFLMIIRETGFPYPNITGLKIFLAFSIPQIPSGMLLWIISSSDRYFITHFLSLAQTGIYSSSGTLAGLISLIYFPINMVLFPLLSRLWEENQLETVKRYLQYSTKIFLMIAIPAAAGLTILSQPLLRLLTTTEFLAGRELVLLLSIGIIFVGLYQIIVNIIYLLKQTRILPFIIVLSAIISIGSNMILLPRIGIIGAAISNIISFALLATIVILWARKSIQFSLDFKFLLKVIIATLLMAVCLSFLKISGIIGVILTAVAGTIVFGTVIFLLRAFPKQDRMLIKSMISGLITNYTKGDK